MKLNAEQIKPRRSVFITIEQIRDDLRPIVSNALKDTVDDVIYNRGDVISADITRKNLNHLLDFNNWKDEDYIQMWCDCCSYEFFNEHKEIDDILLVKEMTNVGFITNVIWIGSR